MSLKRILPLQLLQLLKNNSVYKLYRHSKLSRHHQSLSQAGQDYWVINEAFFQKKNGYFLEIGSADGLYINNTYFLEKYYDWSGICIEANPNFFEQLQSNRNCTCLNICVDEKPGEVDFVFDGLMGGILDRDTDNFARKKDLSKKTRKIKTMTLLDVLKEYEIPKIIDYFSLDVEGAETRILKNFPFEDYTFLSLTIERPSSELQKILADNGYLLVKLIPGLDSFFIHESFKQEYKKNLKRFYSSLRF